MVGNKIVLVMCLTFVLYGCASTGRSTVDRFYPDRVDDVAALNDHRLKQWYRMRNASDWFYADDIYGFATPNVHYPIYYPLRYAKLSNDGKRVYLRSPTRPGEVYFIERSQLSPRNSYCRVFNCFQRPFTRINSVKYCRRRGCWAR